MYCSINNSYFIFYNIWNFSILQNPPLYKTFFSFKYESWYLGITLNLSINYCSDKIYSIKIFLFFINYMWTSTWCYSDLSIDINTMNFLIWCYTTPTNISYLFNYKYKIYYKKFKVIMQVLKNQSKVFYFKQNLY